MKRVYLLLLSLTLMAALGACGDKKSDRESIRGGRGDIRGGTGAGINNSQTGVITTDQNSVDGFVSVMGAPIEVVGYVDRPNTGVYFRGKAAVSTGTTSSGGESPISSANIEIEIRDHLAAEGKMGSLLIKSLRFQRGNIINRGTAEEAVIEFADELQKVIFSGTVPNDRNGQFTGKVYFQNFKGELANGSQYLLGEFRSLLAHFSPVNNILYYL